MGAPHLLVIQEHVVSVLVSEVPGRPGVWNYGRPRTAGPSDVTDTVYWCVSC